MAFQPLSDAGERIRSILGLLIGGPSVVVTDHVDNISIIDSRMWDPEWRYKNSYITLANSLNFAFRDRAKANTTASFESYYWGRGRTPTLVLKRFSEMAPDRVIARIANWFHRLEGGGTTLGEMVSNFLNSFGDPLREMPEQQVAPGE